MPERRFVGLAAGALVLGLALVWPSTLWFRDEVGYVGQARLLVEQGRLRPDALSVLHAWNTPEGPIAGYPVPFPALLALPIAAGRRLVFVIPAGAALLLGFAAARRFESWGRLPGWGFAVLLYPTVALLSRTAMADVPLVAAMVLAWDALARDRRISAFGWCAALVLLKPVGIILAAGLTAGELVRRARAGAGRPWTLAAAGLLPAAAGSLCGLAVTLALNQAATGSIAYAYVHSEHGFALSHVASSGLAHLVTVLVLPPGLLLGAIPLWRRQEYGALAAAGGLLAAMSCFSFVDRGSGPLDSLVVGPRLILPTVVVLLLGWIDGLAGALERLASRAVVGWTIALALFAVTVAVGTALGPRERVRREALEAAERALAERGGHLLGLGDAAFEVGLLARSRVIWAAPGSRDADVVLCAAETESVRTPVRSHSCELPGYAVLREVGPYEILGRETP